MRSKATGGLLIAMSAAGFAFLPIFAKLAYAAGLNIVTLLAARFIIAASCFWVLLTLTKTKWKVDGKSLVALFLLGAVGYGLQSSGYLMSVQYIPTSLAAMLLYTYPVIVSLLTYALGDETFTRRKVAALVIAVAGLGLILGASWKGINMIGAGYAILAAVTYAGYIVASSRVVREVPSLTMSAYICSAAAVAFLAVGCLSGSLHLEQLAVDGWQWVAAIALVSTVLPVVSFFAGVRLTGAYQAAIISTLEPWITGIFSAWLLTERLTAAQFIGGVMIIGGIIMLQMQSAAGNAPGQAAEM